VVADFEHVVVPLDQAGQHRTGPEIDFLRTGRDLNAARRSNFRNALALNNDDLVGHEPVGLAVEQLPGVNHHRLLTLSCQTRATKPECK
jgi:hypothetical protein